jgi:hypothetical protein
VELGDCFHESLHLAEATGFQSPISNFPISLSGLPRSRDEISRFGLVIGSAFFTLVMPLRILAESHQNLRTALFSPVERVMKSLERITLATATAVYAGYLIQQAIRTRSERLFRLAAGESPYERTHPKPRTMKTA